MSLIISHPHYYWPVTSTVGMTVGVTLPIILSQFIYDNHFILLNNSAPAHFNIHSTFFHVDLSLCSPAIFVHAGWKIETNPIRLGLFHQTGQSSTSFRPIYKFNQADWSLYKKQCTAPEAKRPRTKNLNKETANICKIMKEAANISLPQTHRTISRGYHGGMPVWRTSKYDNTKPSTYIHT